MLDDGGGFGILATIDCSQEVLRNGDFVEYGGDANHHDAGDRLCEWPFLALEVHNFAHVGESGYRFCDELWLRSVLIFVPLISVGLEMRVEVYLSHFDHVPCPLGLRGHTLLRRDGPSHKHLVLPSHVGHSS